jgi:probable HAF family extracellular repeat protein
LTWDRKGSYTRAQDINDRGQVVGTASLILSEHAHSLPGKKEEMIDLGIGDEYSSIALKINGGPTRNNHILTFRIPGMSSYGRMG